MAEKEASYETATGGQQDAQKPSAAVLHLPSLTSKPTRAHNNKQQEAERAGAGKDAPDAPAGYHHLSVAQKGKLILPTALWVLLILAGVAFLGLLASLSRTIDTLDTLVELEQEKEARASVSEHLARHARVHPTAGSRAAAEHKHRQHQHKALASRERDESLGGRRDDDLEFSDGHLFPRAPPSSWFSLPSWTSLEPVAAPAAQRPGDEAKLVPMPEGVTIEIVGDGNGPMPPAGLINSIMGQVMPMLDSFMGPSATPGHQPLGRAAQQVVPSGPEMSGGGDDLGAMISAKIDTLNVNLNAANSEQREHSHTTSAREQEIRSLESSVDDLVAKLMAQKLARADGGDDAPAEPLLLNGAHRQHAHRPHHAPRVDEIMPVIRLPVASAHHGSARPGPPLSPLASLLMGGGGGHSLMGDDSSTMIIGPFGSPAELESMLAAGPARIKFASRDDGPGPLASGEINRHGLSNTRRPLARPGSPYELMPLLDSFKDLDEMMSRADSQATREPAAGKAKWDMLSNDLADALIQSALGEQQKPTGSPDSTLPKSESVVVVNGKQLEGGERDKFLSSIFGPTGGDASETKSPLGDLMSAMFEPLRTTTAAGRLDETPLRTQTTLAPSSVSPATVKTLEPMPATASKIEPLLGSTIASGGENSPTDPDVASPADMMNDLLSTMLALPQFSGGPQQASTSGSPSSPGSSSPSVTPLAIVNSTQPASTNTTTTTTTTTTEASLSTTVTRPPSSVSMTTPEGVPVSMLTTLLEALHTPHLESEHATDSLLRDLLGGSSPTEGETPQQVITTTTAPTSSAPTTASARVPTTSTTVPTATASPAGAAKQFGARVIREQDAPTNLPIFDLGPYAGSTSPSIETLEESSTSPTTPNPTTTPAPVGDASSTAAPTTTTTPAVAPSSTSDAVSSSKVNSTTGAVGSKNSTAEQPAKSFFQRADDFLERNLMNFKRFF